MTSKADIEHLRAAIDASRAARSRGDGPYGAVLVSGDGKPLGTAGNSVTSSRDPTAHAETNVIRDVASRVDPQALRNATLYASGEPCPMCAGAIYNAGIRRIVFAVSQSRAAELTEGRSATLQIPVREVLARAKEAVLIEGPILEEEASAVFHDT